MRYHYDRETVFIRGDFRAVSTGVDGGIRRVSTIFNHTVPKNFAHDNPSAYISDILHAKNYDENAFGLLTAVSMRDLCIMQFDYITVFVTAGVSNPNPDPTKPHTINVIVTSEEGLSDAALLETIITVTEAKAHALRLMGRDFTGTTSDAVVVACSAAAEVQHTYAGTFTEPGKRIYAAVLHGVQEALKRHEGTVSARHPTYFIYSRYQNNGWFEGNQDGCPYYPCHFEGQVCTFCYCPFYPCRDKSLGEWVTSSTLHTDIWACTNCHLLHEKKRADYLISHPDADFEEVRKV